MTLKAEKRARREAERAKATAKVQFFRLNYEPCPDDERPSRFSFECPRGRGRCGQLLIAGADLGGGRRAESGKRPACWTWDGNREAPTFAPSIHCLSEAGGRPAGGCGWHGHIRNDVIVA